MKTLAFCLGILLPTLVFSQLDSEKVLHKKLLLGIGLETKLDIEDMRPTYGLAVRGEGLISFQPSIRFAKGWYNSSLIGFGKSMLLARSIFNYYNQSTFIFGTGIGYLNQKNGLNITITANYYVSHFEQEISGVYEDRLTKGFNYNLTATKLYYLKCFSIGPTLRFQCNGSIVGNKLSLGCNSIFGLKIIL